MSDNSRKYYDIGRVLGRISNTFASISFIKKDGSERTIVIQEGAARNNVKGAAASESAQRAVATRKANNPNLLNVWSVHDNGYRSVNMDTVYQIHARGEVHNFD